MNGMFESASAFNQDISSWTGTAATSAQSDMFSGATAFQAKFTCTDAVTGPASSCVGPSPIPDISWHVFVAACLAESAVTGECINWAHSQNTWYGTMPNWDTSLVTHMNGWDYTADVCLGLGCKWTFNGDISQWNTGGVTKMETMFYNASAFDQDISKWDTSQVTDMGWMFGDDVGSAFNHDIGSWNTAQVISMRSMFESASAFNQDIGRWNTAQVLRMNSMFSSAPAFNQDIGSWNTAQVTDMNGMFESASAFNHDISSWTGSAATSAQTDMFSGATAFQAKFACTNADNGPASSCEGPSPIPDASWHDFVGDCLAESAAIGETGECIVWARSKDVWYGTMPNWDVSLVTDMHGYPETGFGNQPNFNADISQWNVSQVTNMYAMFWQATSFNRPIGGWDICTSKVTNMGYMFESASAFNQDIGNWTTEKVTDMQGMFYLASAFNQDIGGWNNIGGWNTALVGTMAYMFAGASAFNQDIGSWNTALVDTMAGMFWSASAFNQDIGSWSTDRVGDMGNMFRDASAFNQDISSWAPYGYGIPEFHSGMFYGATAFQATFECTDPISGPVQSCVYINK